MPTKTLEYSSSIYQESLKLREKLSIYNKNDIEIIKKEEEHQALILELSQKRVLLLDIDKLIKHKDKNIRREAYLIALESKDREICKKVIKSHYKISKKRDGSHSPLPLSFLTLEAFDIFIEEFTIIRKEHKEKYFSLTPIVKYLAANQYDKYLDFFMNLDFFTLDEQDEILYELGHLEKFSSVINQEYQKKHSFFEECNHFKTSIPLLLSKNEDIGLKLLREEKCINYLYEVQPLLHYFGDKKDVELILNFFKSKESKEYPHILFEQIKSLKGGGGNYAYVDVFFEMIGNIDVLVTLAICEQFVYYAKLKEEDEEYDTYWEISNALNDAAYSTDEEIKKNLSDEEKKLIDPIYIKKFWKEIFEKNKNIIHRNERISLSEENKLYSLNSLLDNVLYDTQVKGLNDPLAAELKYLIIYTGKHLPLDEAGYYKKLKEHVNQWEEYIKENKKNLEDGRWWRYGRYVDEEYQS